MLSSLRWRIELLFAAPLPPCETFGLEAGTRRAHRAVAGAGRPRRPRFLCSASRAADSHVDLRVNRRRCGAVQNCADGAPPGFLLFPPASHAL